MCDYYRYINGELRDSNHQFTIVAFIKFFNVNKKVNKFTSLDHKKYLNYRYILRHFRSNYQMHVERWEKFRYKPTIKYEKINHGLEFALQTRINRSVILVISDCDASNLCNALSVQQEFSIIIIALRIERSS